MTYKCSYNAYRNSGITTFQKVTSHNLFGDGFHILVECTNEQIRDLGSKSPLKYYQYHNMYKFIQLFIQSSTYQKLPVKLCRFFKEIFNFTNG